MRACFACRAGFAGRGIPVARPTERDVLTSDPDPRRSLGSAHWTAVVVWAAVIFLASTGWFAESRTDSVLRPLVAWLFPHAGTDAAATMNAVVRKLGHFVEYAVLGWLITRALADARGWQPRHAILAVALAAGYAVTDELHQRFVLGRTAAFGDVVIDVAGAAGAQGVVAAWWRRARNSRVNPGRPDRAAPSAPARR